MGACTPPYFEIEALLDTTLSFGSWSTALANRAGVRFRRGNGAGALADFDESLRLEPTGRNDVRALYSIALGDTAPARTLLARMRPPADSGRGLADFARLHMALGNRTEALRALEQLRALPPTIVVRCAPSTPCSPSLVTWRTLHDALFAPLRGDPRFERLWDETRPRVPWLTGVR